MYSNGLAVGTVPAAAESAEGSAMGGKRNLTGKSKGNCADTNHEDKDKDVENYSDHNNWKTFQTNIKYDQILDARQRGYPQQKKRAASNGSYKAFMSFQLLKIIKNFAKTFISHFPGTLHFFVVQSQCYD